MSILVVEPSEEVAQLLIAAIEHARPGTPVTVQPDPSSAAKALLLAQHTSCAMPAVVLLGPHACSTAKPEELDAIRQAAGAKLPVIALSVDEEVRTALPLDDAYEQPLEWQILSRTVRSMLDKWIK